MIRVRIQSQSADILEIYFTPDSNHTVKDGSTSYAVFVQGKTQEEKDRIPLYGFLYKCDDKGEVKFEFEFPCQSRISSNIVDAAAQSRKVELEVKLGTHHCPPANGKKIASIIIPAK